jgi:hypothetical protein
MSVPSAPRSPAPFGFLLLLLIGIAGFWRSYISRFATIDPAHHVHGLTALSWMALLTVQGVLMRQRRLAQHRRLGRVAYVLGPLFLLAGVQMIVSMLAGNDPFARAHGRRLVAVDVAALASFALLFMLAIRHRRDVHRHARSMAGTGVLLLPPALSRLLPLLSPVIGFEASFNTAFLLTDLLVLACLRLDRPGGRMQSPYLVLLASLLVQQAAFLASRGFS